MTEDFLLKELRLIRREIENDYGADGQRYFRHLLELQQKHTARLVKRPPVPALPRQRRAA